MSSTRLEAASRELFDADLHPGRIRWLIRREPIARDDALSFERTFLSNARGLAAVTGVDGRVLAVDTGRLETISGAYASIRWEAI